jgi:enamine deaminase RidA (YjgF/YER057c/UK114 family)
MIHTLHETGVARQIGAYSDAVEVGPNARWLYSAGTPGLSPDGALPPDITGQAEQAWQNVLDILAKADMGVRDLVKVTTWLKREEDIPAYAKVRAAVLNGYKPAFMLAIIPHLVWSDMLVEIEIVAAKAG